MLNMKNLFRSALMAFVSLPLLALVAFGQITNVTDDQSTPTPGAGHDYLHMLNETVNPASGSVSIRIGVPTPKGLGISLPFSFNYDSNGVNHLINPISISDALPTDSTVVYQTYWTSDWSAISQGGWSYGLPSLTWTPDPYPGMVTTTGSYTCQYSTNYMFQDAGGGRHALGLSSLNNSDPVCQPNTVSHGKDDYVLASYLSGGSVIVADADGTTYNFSAPYVDPGNYQQGWTPTTLPTITDRNGHQIAATGTTLSLLPPTGGYTGFGFTEVASGRQLLQASGFGNTGDTVSVPGLNGQPLTYTLTWNPIGGAGIQVGFETVTNPMNMCGDFLFTGNGYSAVRAITLPNGQQYRFQYDSDNPSYYDQSSTGPYGLVSKITYPTGGYVRYVWGENTLSNYIQGGWYWDNTQGWVMQGTGCSYLYGVPAVMDRYISYDGQSEVLHQHFTYTTNWNNSVNEQWTAKTTTVVTSDLVAGTTTETDYNYLPAYVAAQPIPPFENQPLPSQVPVENAVITRSGQGSSAPILRTSTKFWWDPYLLQGEQVVDNGVVTSDQFFEYASFGLIGDRYECGAGQTCYCPPGNICPSPYVINGTQPPTVFSRRTNYQYATIPNHNYSYPDGTTPQGISDCPNPHYGDRDHNPRLFRYGLADRLRI